MLIMQFFFLKDAKFTAMYKIIHLYCLSQRKHINWFKCSAYWFNSKPNTDIEQVFPLKEKSREIVVILWVNVTNGASLLLAINQAGDTQTCVLEAAAS